jgi:hypothetical protein
MCESLGGFGEKYSDRLKIKPDKEMPFFLFDK